MKFWGGKSQQEGIGLRIEQKTFSWDWLCNFPAQHETMSGVIYGVILKRALVHSAIYQNSQCSLQIAVNHNENRSNMLLVSPLKIHRNVHTRLTSSSSLFNQCVRFESRWSVSWLIFVFASHCWGNLSHN